MAINNIQNMTTNDNVNRIMNEIKFEQPENNKNIRGDTDLSQAIKLTEKPAEYLDIHDAIERLNNLINMFNKRLKFSVHDGTNQVVVKIIDQKTDKVVREIPPKEVIKFIDRFHKLLGVFIDKKS